MKEAISELNLTVIIVLAVAGLVALFSLVIWPIIEGGLEQSANCSDAVCESCNEHTGICECHMPNESETFDCAYKG